MNLANFATYVRRTTCRSRRLVVYSASLDIDSCCGSNSIRLTFATNFHVVSAASHIDAARRYGAATPTRVPNAVGGKRVADRHALVPPRPEHIAVRAAAVPPPPSRYNRCRCRLGLLASRRPPLFPSSLSTLLYGCTAALSPPTMG